MKTKTQNEIYIGSLKYYSDLGIYTSGFAIGYAIFQGSLLLAIIGGGFYGVMTILIRCLK